jgi:hypothetical protein
MLSNQLCKKYILDACIFFFCHPPGLPPVSEPRPVDMFSPVRELVGFTSVSTKPEVGVGEDYDHGILCAIFTLFV